MPDAERDRTPNPYLNVLDTYELSRAVEQSIAGEDRETLRKLLTDFRYFEARIICHSVFDLAADFAAALNALPAEDPGRAEIALIHEAITLDLDFLSRHPGSLFQVLWNRCWWHDSPQLTELIASEQRRHAMVPKTRNVADWLLEKLTVLRRIISQKPEPLINPQNLIEIPPDTEIFRLAERWRSQKDRLTPTFTWLNALLPPEQPLGRGIRNVFHDYGHAVRHMLVSPDNSLVGTVEALQAAWHKDDTSRIRVHSVTSGMEILRSEYNGALDCVAFSPDQRRLIAVGRTGSVVSWDIKSGAEREHTKVENLSTDLVLTSCDGGRFAISATPRGPRWCMWIFWLLTEIGHRVASSIVPLLFTFGFRTTFQFIDIDACEHKLVLRLVGANICSTRLSPCGRWLAVGGVRRVRMFDLKRQRRWFEMWSFRQADWSWTLRGGVTELSFSHDGSCVIGRVRRFGTQTETKLKAWEVATGHEICDFELVDEDVVSMGETGTELVALSKSDTFLRWDLGTGSLLSRSQLPMHIGVDAAFSPDGKLLVAHKGSPDECVNVWDWGRNLITSRDFAPRFEDDVRQLTLSSSGKVLIVTTRRHDLWILDATKGTLISRVSGGRNYKGSCMSGDGRLLATHSPLRLWRTDDGSRVALPVKRTAVECVAFSSGGEVLAAGIPIAHDVHHVSVWCIRERREIVSREFKGAISKVVVSEDGEYIASQDVNGKVRVLATRSRETVAAWKTSDQLEHIRYDSFRKCFSISLITRSADGQGVRLVEKRDCSNGRMLARHSEPMYCFHAQAFEREDERAKDLAVFRSDDNEVMAWYEECFFNLIEPSRDARLFVGIRNDRLHVFRLEGNVNYEIEDVLQDELESAVATENYDRAIQFRDRLQQERERTNRTSSGSGLRV